ncbi:MAG TPA: hypothetical protein VG247_24925 [Pseudonocardiaceae bacterium]|jgi:multisubunit Na+/H+ antiporter MnhB subunit|nr:hypothetical protein [Pseudonocardiaceae bacterium]
MVVGIVALSGCEWIPFGGVIIAAVAIVLSALGMQRAQRENKSGRGMAIAGLCTGLVAAVGAIILTIVFLVALASVGAVTTYDTCIQNNPTTWTTVC